MRVKRVGEDHFVKREIAGVAPSIILTRPKYAHNVGSALRSASCYGFKQVWFTGDRIGIDPDKGDRLPREERMKGYTEVDLIASDRPFDRLPKGAVPVAIEINPGAQQLPQFEHPENAVYVFGPEDGGVDRVTMGLCHHVVMIPTAHCLNLGNAVSTVLYDRLLKEQAKDPSRVLPTASYLNEVREIGVGDLYDRKGVWMGSNAEHRPR